MLAAVHDCAFQRESDFYGADYVPPPGSGCPAWHERMIREALYYKVLFDAAIVGGMVLVRRGQNCMELRSLFDAAFQHRGFGTESMRFAEATWPEAVRWILATPYRSVDNQRLYERMGYRKAGQTDPLCPSGFCLYLYEKIRTQ